MTQQLKNLIQTTDVEYVVSNCIGEIINPVVYYMNINAANSKTYKVNYKDMIMKIFIIHGLM